MHVGSLLCMQEVRWQQHTAAATTRKEPQVRIWPQRQLWQSSSVESDPHLWLLEANVEQVRAPVPHQAMHTTLRP
jgi:hypothetical protein